MVMTTKMIKIIWKTLGFWQYYLFITKNYNDIDNKIIIDVESYSKSNKIHVSDTVIQLATLYNPLYKCP